MNNTLRKRTLDDLSRHLTRTRTCRETITFGYRQTSPNKYDVKRIFFHCHSYFCPHCAKKKKGLLLKKIKTIKPGQTLRFLTLTLSTKQYSSEESLFKISEFVNLWVKYMRYRGFSFQYFKIIEFTKNQQAHVHILVNCFLPLTVALNVWHFITGSYIGWIKLIKNKSIAISYILKYMTKAVGTDSNHLFYLLAKRRYSYSQSFFLPVIYKTLYTLSRIYFYSETSFFDLARKFFKNNKFNYNLINFNFIL